MKTRRFLSLNLVLASGLLIAAAPAGAADGSIDLELTVVWPDSCGPRLLPLTAHDLGHSLDDRDLYDPREVVETHIRLTTFEEMTGAVRRLVTRAERLSDPTEADAALLFAQDTFNGLPIAEYLTIEDFLEENRNYTGVVMPLEVLLQYLKDAGTPDELVSAIRDSANDCHVGG